jgi:hypothetical protein
VPDHLLDLAEFDPLAIDLHLAVVAADEVEIAVRPAAHEIAGALEPRRHRFDFRRATSCASVLAQELRRRPTSKNRR